MRRWTTIDEWPRTPRFVLRTSGQNHEAVQPFLADSGGPRRRPRRWAAFAGAAFCLAAAGCALMRPTAPAPEEVVNGRRLAQAARNAMQREQWERAESLAQRAMEAAPDDSESRRLYADVLWRRGRRAEAAAQIDNVLAQGDDDQALHLERARMSLEMGQLPQALRGVQTALDLDPQRPEPWRLRAKVRQQQGDLRGALADNQRALSFEPKNRELLFNMTQLYQQLGEPQRALANAQALLDTFPRGEEPAQLHEELGNICAALGRPEAAADAYLAARERGGPTPGLCTRLAEARLRCGRMLEAGHAAQEALSLDPQYAPARHVLERLELARRPEAVSAR